MLNVKDYGAIGNGTDDTVAIQSALEAAAQTGQGVYVPEGEYVITATPHPLAPGFASAGLVTEVPIIGANRKFTKFKLNASAPPDTWGIINKHIGGGGGDSELEFRDFTFDGNSTNQSNPTHGVGVMRAHDVNFTRVRVHSNHGVTPGGAGETMAFQVTLCGNVVHTDCIAEGGSGETATGFSANASTNVIYTGCRAEGLMHGHGFTHWTCSHIAYSNCIAVRNGYYGFNGEFSEEIAYATCLSGGKAANHDTAVPYMQAENIGNEHSGYVVLNSKRLSYVGNHARLNGGPEFVNSGGSNIKRSSNFGF